MTHNQYPSLWDLNPASAYVEAVDHAQRARREAHVQTVSTPVRSKRRSHVFASILSKLAVPPSVLTPRSAAVMTGVAVVCGAAINWIA